MRLFKKNDTQKNNKKLPMTGRVKKGLGFIKYNGMTAEQFVWAWIKSEFIMPKKLLFSPDNLYYEALKETIDIHEKEALGIRIRRKQKSRQRKKSQKSKEVSYD